MMESDKLIDDTVPASEEEELDFFEVQDNNPKEEPKRRAPALDDRWNLLYLAFLLFGVCSVLPWNFCITAEGYWLYKLRTVNGTSSDPKSELQTMFSSYLSIAATLPMTLFLLVSTVLSSKISHQVRSQTSLFVMLLLFLLTTVLAKMDTDQWQYRFFIITMVTVVLMNSFSAIFQASLMGLANAFPSRYMQAVMNGQCVGAIFAALANIIAIAVGVSPKAAGFTYFCIAVFTLLISLVSYCSLNKMSYYCYHMAEIREAESTAETRDLLLSHENNYFWQILKRIWIYGFSAFLTYSATLSVFPSIAVLVVSRNADNKSDITNKFFIPVGCFLIYNMGDLTGRMLAGVIKIPSSKSLLLPVLTILRLSMILLLMLCNAQPRHHLPVIFDSDVEYIVLILVLGLTNGYLIYLSVLHAAQQIGMEFRETAGSMMAFLIGSGLTAGALLSNLLVRCL